MNTEIIYEKRYSNKCDTADITKGPDTETPSFDEIMKKFHGKIRYKVIRESLTSSEVFIRKSIDIAAFYKFDIKIEQQPDCIRTLLSFDCCGGLRYMNSLFGMADQISFLEDASERDITVCLDYCAPIVVP